MPIPISRYREPLVLPWISYLSLYWKYLGPRIFVSFILAIFAGVVEGFGLFLVVPILASILNSPDMENDNKVSFVVGVLEDFFSYFEINYSPENLFLVIGTIFVIKGIFLFSANSYNARLRGELVMSLKTKLLDMFDSMSYEYYAERSSGHFTNVVNLQAEKAILAFRYLTSMGMQSVIAAFYIMLAFVLSWQFGLLTLVLGMVFQLFFRSTNRKLKDLSRAAADQNGRLNEFVVQVVQCFEYLSLTNRISRFKARAAVMVEVLMDNQVKSGIASAFANSIKEPLAVLSLIGVLSVLLFKMQVDVAPLLVSALLFYRALGMLFLIQSGWQGVLENIGSFEKVDEELRQHEIHKENSGDVVIRQLSDKIKLVNVVFMYPKSSAPVINKLNLSISARQSIGIIGASGAGKTTLIRLITLGSVPTSGLMEIDGVDHTRVDKKAWRSSIGYVPQQPAIFDDSILNNICLWDQREDVMERVRESCVLANIADFIETLPEGLETRVGDRGLKLSGGQLQRLTIARELYKRPSVLILDEATSALDSQAEDVIRESIETLVGKYTIIVVAHRFSTLRNLERLIVLDEGKVVEDGSWDELIADHSSRLSYLAKYQKI